MATESWSTGLCACEGVLAALCCPCCFASTNAKHLGFTGACCGCPCVYPGPNAARKHRQQARTMFRIRGDGACGDFLATCCCPCLVHAQIRREIGIRTTAPTQMGSMTGQPQPAYANGAPTQ